MYWTTVGDISAQIELSNQIVDLIQSITKEADFTSMGVDQHAEYFLLFCGEQIPV